MKTAGVYKIKNERNDKIYIGSSANLARRWTEHIRKLNNGNHENWKLQNDWNEYKITDFTFSILEMFEKERGLLTREQFYIDLCIKHYGEEKLYNIVKDMKETAKKFFEKRQTITKEDKPKKIKEPKQKRVSEKTLFHNMIDSHLNKIIDDFYVQLTVYRKTFEYEEFLKSVHKYLDDNNIDKIHSDLNTFDNSLKNYLRRSLKISIISTEYYSDETLNKFNLIKTQQLIMSRELRDEIKEYASSIYHHNLTTI